MVDSYWEKEAEEIWERIDKYIDLKFKNKKEFQEKLKQYLSDDPRGRTLIKHSDEIYENSEAKDIAEYNIESIKATGALPHEAKEKPVKSVKVVFKPIAPAKPTIQVKKSERQKSYKRTRGIWTDKMSKYLKEHSKINDNKQLMLSINKRFGVKMTVHAVRTKKYRLRGSKTDAPRFTT